jgi:hypothetical protein
MNRRLVPRLLPLLMRRRNTREREVAGEAEWDEDLIEPFDRSVSGRGERRNSKEVRAERPPGWDASARERND